MISALLHAFDEASKEGRHAALEWPLNWPSMLELLHEVGLQSHEDLGKVDAQHAGWDRTNTTRCPHGCHHGGGAASGPGRGGASPRLSRPAGLYAVRLTSRRTDAARTREKEEAASPRSLPPFCLYAQGGQGARSLSLPLVSGEGGLSSFSFHLRFISHSFLFPEGDEAAGKRRGRRAGGWGGRAASVVSAARGASSAASGCVEVGRRILGTGALAGSLRRCGGHGRAELGSPDPAMPGARPSGSGDRPFLPRRPRGPPGGTWLGSGLGAHWGLRVSPPGSTVSDFGHPKGISL